MIILSYLTLLQRDTWWYCSYWHVRILHFDCTGMWTREFWISSSALYHCAIKNLVFSYENSRYLTLLERGWWWYHCHWTCESFFHFACTGMWTRDHKIYSPALYHCGMVMCGFVIWLISGIYLWCRGIGGGIVLTGPVRVFMARTGIGS